MTVWNGLVAPVGTPVAIVQRLNAAVNEGLRAPEIKTTLANFGSEPLTGTPQDFSTFVAAEAKKWADAVRLAGVKID
jgi:tripartite-type tricarboxylate transporter receptor subunit TctC